MNSTGVDFVRFLFSMADRRLNLADLNIQQQMVLSCATPCIQGISDPQMAQAMTTLVNDRLAAAISNNTVRFGAFATMSMHDPTVAAAELERTVKNFGFLGALLNDYQQSGPDDNIS